MTGSNVYSGYNARCAPTANGAAGAGELRCLWSASPSISFRVDAKIVPPAEHLGDPILLTRFSRRREISRQRENYRSTNFCAGAKFPASGKIVPSTEHLGDRHAEHSDR